MGYVCQFVCTLPSSTHFGRKLLENSALQNYKAARVIAAKIEILPAMGSVRVLCSEEMLVVPLWLTNRVYICITSQDVFGHWNSQALTVVSDCTKRSFWGVISTPTLLLILKQMIVLSSWHNFSPLLTPGKPPPLSLPWKEKTRAVTGNKFLTF